jgi:hypothetical protein
MCRDPLNKHPFIAKIREIQPDERHGGHLLRVLWYYRPEDGGEPLLGRRLGCRNVAASFG